jgi:hypothetical protein
MEKDKLQNFLKIINSFVTTSRKTEGSVPLRVASDGSQSNSSQEEKERTELLNSISCDYQLTVRLRNTSLTRRQLSLLLAILNYQVAYFGITFGMYLMLDHLYSILCGNKVEPIDIKDKFIRETVFVSKIILSSVSSRPLSLVFCTMIPLDLQRALSSNNLLMTRRTYGSRYSVYRPEALLEVLTVPLDILMNRVLANTVPFSSYCKGYGESHPNARKSKTKPSAELDRVDEEKDYLRLEDIPTLLLLNQLEQRYKYRKERES